MPRQSKALVKEAMALGIDVDGRWGDETIQEHIDAVKADQMKSEADAKAEEAARQLEIEAGAGADGAVGAAGADAAVAGGEDPEVAGLAELHDGGLVSSVGDEKADGDGQPVGEAEVMARNDGVVSDGAGDTTAGGEADAGTGAGELASAPALRADDGSVPVAAEGTAETAQDGKPVAADHVGKDGEGLGVTEDPVAEAEDAVDDEPQDDSTDLGDGSGDGASTLTSNGSAEPEPPADQADPGPALPNPDAEREAVDKAYEAMTGPIAGAYDAADAVFIALTGGQTSDEAKAFQAEGHWLEADSDGVMLVVHAMVPFVRTWPDAPPEALYTHTLANVEGETKPWAELPAVHRIAWTMFRDALVGIDKMITAERDRLIGREEPRTMRRIPLDESTLEEVDDPFALSDSGKAQAKRDAALERDLSLTGL